MLNPWYVIVWRMLWWIPVQVSRVLLVAFTFIGWGPEIAAEVMRDTR